MTRCGNVLKNHDVVRTLINPSKFDHGNPNPPERSASWSAQKNEDLGFDLFFTSQNSRILNIYIYNIFVQYMPHVPIEYHMYKWFKLFFNWRTEFFPYQKFENETILVPWLPTRSCWLAIAPATCQLDGNRP